MTESARLRDQLEAAVVINGEIVRLRIENEALRTKVEAIAAKWDAMNGIDEAENFATDLREALARHPVESKGEEP